jgi:glycosyltransferase involved in cell wall biosynthesis
LVNGKKVVVVLPAYNAAKTIKMTYEERPLAFVDDVVLEDDASWDGTPEVAQELGIKVIIHGKNIGTAEMR